MGEGSDVNEGDGGIREKLINDRLGFSGAEAGVDDLLGRVVAAENPFQGIDLRRKSVDVFVTLVAMKADENWSHLGIGMISDKGPVAQQQQFLARRRLTERESTGIAPPGIDIDRQRIPEGVGPGAPEVSDVVSSERNDAERML